MLIKDANNRAIRATVVRVAAAKLIRILANRLKKARNYIKIYVYSLLLLY